MMGPSVGRQDRLFYAFDLEDVVPPDHLLRRIDAVLDLSWLRREMAPHYSHLGCPSVCPELMVRILLIGYCYSIRSERRLCEEVKLNLAYRWFCGLGLEDSVPHHSTFSVNRHGRFRDSDILRKVFEEVVCGCMQAGLVGGEGFAVDASVIEANASRFQRVEGSHVSWTET
jgi:transposase